MVRGGSSGDNNSGGVKTLATWVLEAVFNDGDISFDEDDCNESYDTSGSSSSSEADIDEDDDSIENIEDDEVF